MESSFFRQCHYDLMQKRWRGKPLQALVAQTKQDLVLPKKRLLAELDYFANTKPKINRLLQISLLVFGAWNQILLTIL